MPIRIKDIANTASASSTLDFFAIDGNTNNTRKLSAFSPSFGGSVVVAGTLTVSGSGTTAIGGMVKGAAATYSGNPPTGVATAFQVDVENGSTRDLFTFGDTTRCGMLRGYHDGSHRVEWRFGRYFAGAFAEYLRITGVAATDAVLSVYGTTNSTGATSGALIVGNGTNGGIGVSGRSFFAEQVNVKALEATGTASAYNTTGGIGLVGASGSSYASIKAYTDAAGTEKTIALNPSAGAGVHIGGTGNVIGGGLRVGSVAGIGTAPDAAIGVNNQPTLTGTFQYGVYSAPTINSATADSGFFSLRTAASTAVSSAFALRAFTATLGSGSTINTIFGLKIENFGGAGITHAYGIDIAAQTGAATTNVGLRNAGLTLLTGTSPSRIHQLQIYNSSAAGVGAAISGAQFQATPGYSTFIGTTADGANATYQGGSLGSVIQNQTGYVISDAAYGLLLHGINGGIKFAAGNPGTQYGTISNAGVWYISTTIDSTTKSDGALVVSGGVGVEKNIIAGSGIAARGTLTLPAAWTGAYGIGLEHNNATATSRIFYGDGTGYALKFASRSASATTDRMTLTDTGNLTVSGTLTASGGGSHVFGTTNTVTLSSGAVTATGIISTTGGIQRIINTSGAFQIYKDATPSKAARFSFNTAVTDAISLGVYDGTSWIDSFLLTATQATLTNPLTISGTSSFVRVSNITQNAMLADFSSNYTGGAAFPYVVLGSSVDPTTSGARIAVGTDYSNNFSASLFLQTRNAGGTLQTSLSIASNQAATFASTITTGGKVEVQRLTQSNDTSEPYFTAVGGADATLGALIVHIGGRPSATGGNRYGYISVGDAAAMRPLSLCDNGSGAYGQVLVRSSSNSNDNISGALVVTGGVGIGGNVNMGGRLFINNTSAANGALSPSAIVATFGADATLGGLTFNVKGFPSATAGSRYVQLSAADSLSFREMRINDQGGNVVLGASSSTVTASGTLIASAGTNAFRIPTAQTPASQTATGTTGQITWDSSYIYVCTATNNWGRSSLSWSGGGGGGGGGSSNIWIPASEWIPRTTNGCGINSLESTTNRVNYDVLEFDPAVVEYAQAMVTLPNNWNAGTVTAKFHWTAASGSGDVVWQLSGRAYANDDAIDQATGTAQSSTDTLTAANDLDISPATSAITLAGTAANGNPVVFELSRNATAGGDTLAVDARLIGVEISYTI
jgi:hypothetical protein